MMSAISTLLSALLAGTAEGRTFAVAAGAAILALVVRCFCTTGAAAMSFRSSRAVKKTLLFSFQRPLRTYIFDKKLLP